MFHRISTILPCVVYGRWLEFVSPISPTARSGRLLASWVLRFAWNIHYLNRILVADNSQFPFTSCSRPPIPILQSRNFVVRLLDRLVQCRLVQPVHHTRSIENPRFAILPSEPRRLSWALTF